jgi:hypothetical protein
MVNTSRFMPEALGHRAQVWFNHVSYVKHFFFSGSKQKSEQLRSKKMVKAYANGHNKNSGYESLGEFP